MVLHRLGDGNQHTDRLFWGYNPACSTSPPVCNARLDTVLKGSGFSKLLLTKLIIPADGWFERTGEKGAKQTWSISAKDNKPVLIAGITAWEPNKEILAQTGFAIITDDSAGEMIDIHYRCPVTLTPDDARLWLDPSISARDALELLSTPRPESAFRWWPVTKKMGNSRYQLPDATQPINPI